MRPPRWVIPGAAVFVLASCALVMSPAEQARLIASESGMMELHLPDRRVRGFIKGASTGPDAKKALTIYVESDGAPWLWRDEPPQDPTPLRPLVLGLAVADRSQAVAYLGRPCQYLEEASLSNCDPALWTRGRFRTDAVDMMARAVDALKDAAGVSVINLVGYSGGGAMAALLAARRGDVACLVTIAAPLDTTAWTAALGVSPLATSLNPLDYAQRLHKVRQTHFRGMRDRVVPPETIQKFINRVPGALILDIESFDHECCWASRWQELLANSCLNE